MLGTHSRGADPLLVDVDAALEHDVDHVLSADFLRFDFDAARLPRGEHLVLALPLAGQHYAVVGDFVQIVHVFDAELDTLVLTAHVAEVRELFIGELGVDDISVGKFHVMTREERFKLGIAELSVMDRVTSRGRDRGEVVFAHELVGYFEAFALAESVIVNH
jgi:hypothetical protein